MAGYINKYPTLSAYTADASDRKSLGGSTVNLITEGDGEVKYEKGLNPLHLPPFTIRCKFAQGYTPEPSSSTTWDSKTLVDQAENVWDITKNDTSWYAMFWDASNLLEVLGANTTGVTDMRSMFGKCVNLRSVSLFDTSAVTTTGAMFNHCEILPKVPLYDLHNVTVMTNMFLHCHALTTVPCFDTSNVTTMKQTFAECNRLKKVPLFNTSNVTIMQSTFNGCHELIDVPAFNTSNVTTFDGTFARCHSLKSVPSLDTSKATTLNSMFQHCYNLETVGTYDASSATDIERMYFCCEKLKRVNPMPVKAGCNMSRVFDTLVEGSSEQHQSSLEEIPNWDWTKASTLAKVFRGCTALTSIPDIGVPTNATTCASMFENCPNISSGITRAYNNLSSSSSITTHTNTFKDCGSNTTTGSAELAKIPSDWK
jgi:surface protein